MSLHMCLISFFNLSFSLCTRHGYETISLRYDFMEHRQAVHSHNSRSPIMWCHKRAYFCQKMGDRRGENSRKWQAQG